MTPLLTQQKNSIIKLFRWAFSLYWSLGPILFLSYIITSILKELSNLIYPAIFALIVDQLIGYSQNPSQGTIELLIFIIVGITITLSFLASINRYVRATTRMKMRFKPRTLLYEKLKFMGLQFQEDPEILNKITRYRENQWVMQGLFELIGGFIGIIIASLSAIAIILIYIPVIIPIIVIVSIPSLLINRAYIRKTYELDIKYTKENRISDGNVGFLITSSPFKEVNMIGGYDYLKNIFEKFSNFLINAQVKIRTDWHIFSFFADVFKQIYLIIAIILLVGLIQNNYITVGQFLFLFSTIRTFSGQIEGFISIYTDLNEQLFKLKDSKELLDMPKLEEDGKVSLGELELAPKIEFENVTFSYPRSEKKVLQNFNLRINPGEKVAIVGHNGAGKTTLIKLLTRLYRPQEGKVEINDTNVNDLVIDDFYKNLGVLFQDYNTYEYLSVRENVMLGRTDESTDDAAIWNALEYADAKEFVEEYPNGLDTMLSEKFEGGIRPSTGQWQKIALARFFYRDSKILILDEPTASIDAVAEANIFDRIYQFIENKTVIIVSHRFSTVRNADRIIVFENGQVIEEGSHEELLAKKGAYAKAFNLQAKGYKK